MEQERLFLAEDGALYRLLYLPLQMVAVAVEPDARQDSEGVADKRHLPQEAAAAAAAGRHP